MRRIKNRNDTRTTTIATTGTVANEVARVGGDVKYVAGELGKDVKAGGDLVNRLTAGIPYNKYVFGVTDRIGQGIESIENISPKKYLYISSVGYFASSTSQYIFNGDIDHSKSWSNDPVFNINLPCNRNDGWCS
ncbi:hypothetical protein Q7533_07540 [Glaesserella parasuis]|nr:hypothetical protein [Glaesserella parasuis]